MSSFMSPINCSTRPWKKSGRVLLRLINVTLCPRAMAYSTCSASEARAAEMRMLSGFRARYGFGNDEIRNRTETDRATNGGRCLEKSAATNGHRLNLRSSVGWSDSQNMTGERGLRQSAPFMAMYGLC
jgi:hypothetical protein